MSLHLTDDPAADRLLTDNPLALLIGMLLDQQVAMETAFAGDLSRCGIPRASQPGFLRCAGDGAPAPWAASTRRAAPGYAQRRNPADATRSVARDRRSRDEQQPRRSFVRRAGCRAMRG
jgi:hypothetical protein